MAIFVKFNHNEHISETCVLICKWIVVLCCVVSLEESESLKIKFQCT